MGHGPANGRALDDVVDELRSACIEVQLKRMLCFGHPLGGDVPVAGIMRGGRIQFEIDGQGLLRAEQVVGDGADDRVDRLCLRFGALHTVLERVGRLDHEIFE